MLFSASLPLYTGLVARALGARDVTLADARPGVRAHAQRLGLDTLRPRQLRRRPAAALVVDCSVSGLARALLAQRPTACARARARSRRSARIPALQMYARNVTLHVGRAHVRTLIPEVLELIVDGRLDPQAVPATVAPLDEAPSVLREHFLGGGVKTILTA